MHLFELYTQLSTRGATMESNRKSYPEKIRCIAEDITQMQQLAELDHSVNQLRKIADDLEEWLKQEQLEAT
jgi:hypothetical protein